MSRSENTPEDFAARALELLEQAYAYYTPPLKTVTGSRADADSEPYFEYVKAA